MRPTFANTLLRTLRRLQRQGQPTTSSAAASTGSVNTNTFKESGYRFNYFEPKVSIGFLAHNPLILISFCPVSHSFT